MKKYNPIIIAVAILSVFTTALTAQIEIKGRLEQGLSGKKNFFEIINTVHSFYNEEKGNLLPGNTAALEYINRQLKFWKRWEWYNRARLNTYQEVINVDLYNWNLNKNISLNSTSGGNISSSNTGTWLPLGPDSYVRTLYAHTGGLGRVNCIAFHPTDPNIIFIGTPAGGLWKSTNEGTTWVSLTDHIPSIGVSGIIIDYSNPNTIYILTGDGDGKVRKSIGVLKSTDGGINWHLTGTFPNTGSIDFWGYKLIQDPSNPLILLVATTNGIYKTTNGGNSWLQSITGDVTDIEFYPGNSNIVYAVKKNQLTNPLFRSYNKGDNFSNGSITGEPGSSTRLAIGVTPHSPSKVYLLAGPATGSGSFNGVYLSSDTGKNFTLQANSPNILGRATDGSDGADQAWYDLALAINPANSTNIITGGIDVWASTNSGVNFSLKTNWREPAVPPGQYVHADIHDLAYNPLNNKLFVCSDGGVAKSSDNGTNWTHIWNGLQIMQFYHMTGYEGNNELLIGGTQDNGSNYRKTNSSTFYHVLGADGYSSMIDYTNTNIIFCSANENLYRSYDGGINYDSITPTLPFDNSFPMVAMHVTDHNTIFCGKASSVYKSTNAGGVWTDLGVSGNVALNTCPSNGNRLYAASKNIGNPGALSDDLYRIDGTTATVLTNNPGYPLNFGLRLTDIAVLPANSDIVCITFGGYDSLRKVFTSGNAGANWTNITGGLPNAAVTAVEYDNNGNLYIGTDVGVFYKGSSMTEWIPFYNGLPKSPISDIVINETAGTITVSTFGRGVYRSDLFSPCTSSLNLTGLINGNKFYEASSTVSSTQNVFGGSGTEVYYKAGSSITMNPGFEVKAGNYFKAALGPCASGIPLHSRLYTAYEVRNADEILKSDLVQISDLPSSMENTFTITELPDGDKELFISLKEKQFVQCYFIDETHEILAKLIRQSLTPGQYKHVFNDDKLKNGKVKLNIHLGNVIQSVNVK
jgi:Two component regulator propeller